jgi:hypothetical protein
MPDSGKIHNRALANSASNGRSILHIPSPRFAERGEVPTPTMEEAGVRNPEFPDGVYPREKVRTSSFKNRRLRNLRESLTARTSASGSIENGSAKFLIDLFAPSQ